MATFWHFSVNWLAVILPLASAQAPLWSGVQSTLLTHSISTACDAALNTTISCPVSIQMLIHPIHDAKWNQTGLDELCASACQSDLASLVGKVEGACGNETFFFYDEEVTWADHLKYMQSQHHHVCLKDLQAGQFCLEQEKTWNISTLVAQGRATWPTHTTKCYAALSDDGPQWMLHDNGSCIDAPAIYSDRQQYISSDSVPLTNQPQAADYYYERGAMIADDNYGWPKELEFDEYPLEIQCSYCMIERIVHGFERESAQPWTETSPSMWQNVQDNCGIQRTITPAFNNSIFDPSLNFDPVEVPLDYSRCLALLNTTAPTSCQQAAIDFSVPAAALRELNYNQYCPSLSAGATLCAVPSCPIGVNTGGAKSFMHWNTLIDASMIHDGDAVCVGPDGGMYELPPVENPSNTSASSSLQGSSTSTTAAPSTLTSTSSVILSTTRSSKGICLKFHLAVLGDTCSKVVQKYSITVDDFKQWNPVLQGLCNLLNVGILYCVKQ